VLVYRLNRHLSHSIPRATLLTLAYSFGSLAFYYGTVVNPWQLINGVTWVALYLLATRERRPALAAEVGLGVLLGAAVSLHLTAAFVIPVVAAWVLVRWRAGALLAVCAGIALGLVPLLLYHQMIFGSVLTTAYSHRVDTGVATIMSQGVLGYSFPSPRLVVQLLVGYQRGLLLHVPMALLALWVAPLVARHGTTARNRQIMLFASIGAAWILLLNAARAADWGGGTFFFGPRYLMPALPFVWLLVAEASRTIGPRLLVLVASLSVLINWIGAQYGEHGYLPAVVAEFLVKGPHFPVLEWIPTLLSQIGRSPSISSLGIATVLLVALWLIWWGDKVLPEAGFGQT
jgi:hypothetical protein